MVSSEDIIEDNVPDFNLEPPDTNNNENNSNIQHENKQNTTKIPNIALASLRYGLENRATAAIATATLQDYGLLDSNPALVIDPSKVMRWKTKVMEENQQLSDQQTKDETITCLFFDGRRDMTKKLIFNQETGKFSKTTEVEEHYSLTKGHFLLIYIF